MNLKEPDSAEDPLQMRRMSKGSGQQHKSSVKKVEEFKRQTQAQEMFNMMQKMQGPKKKVLNRINTKGDPETE